MSVNKETQEPTLSVDSVLVFKPKAIRKQKDLTKFKKEGKKLLRFYDDHVEIVDNKSKKGVQKVVQTIRYDNIKNVKIDEFNKDAIQVFVSGKNEEKLCHQFLIDDEKTAKEAQRYFTQSSAKKEETNDLSSTLKNDESKTKDQNTSNCYIPKQKMSKSISEASEEPIIQYNDSEHMYHRSSRKPEMNYINPISDMYPGNYHEKSSYRSPINTGFPSQKAIIKPRMYDESPDNSFYKRGMSDEISLHSAHNMYKNGLTGLPTMYKQPSYQYSSNAYSDKCSTCDNTLNYTKSDDSVCSTCYNNNRSSSCTSSERTYISKSRQQPRSLTYYMPFVELSSKRPQY